MSHRKAYHQLGKRHRVARIDVARARNFENDQNLVQADVQLEEDAEELFVPANQQIM